MNARQLETKLHSVSSKSECNSEVNVIEPTVGTLLFFNSVASIVRKGINKHVFEEHHYFTD